MRISTWNASCCFGSATGSCTSIRQRVVSLDNLARQCISGGPPSVPALCFALVFRLWGRNTKFDRRPPQQRNNTRSASAPDGQSPPSGTWSSRSSVRKSQRSVQKRPGNDVAIPVIFDVAFCSLFPIRFRNRIRTRLTHPTRRFTLTPLLPHAGETSAPRVNVVPSNPVFAQASCTDAALNGLAQSAGADADLCAFIRWGGWQAGAH